MSQASITLQPDEQLAFAGLARMLVRADGTFSVEEATALDRVAAELLAPTTTAAPYRQSPIGPADPEAILALMDRAAIELPDDEAVKRAALAVVRPEARSAIYGSLFEIASSDVVTRDEWPILDWLAEQWAVEMEPES